MAQVNIPAAKLVAHFYSGLFWCGWPAAEENLSAAMRSTCC